MAQLSGPVAAIGAIGSILLATALSTTFTWWGSALSDLGIVGTTAWLFNGGLVIASVVGLPYGWALWSAAADMLGGIRAATFIAALLTMAGVGLFPSGEMLHFPFAVAFFLLCAITQAVDGIARFHLPTGKLSIGTGVSSIAIWPLWIGWLVPGSGIAIPEFIGAVLFCLWILALSPERPGSS
jgi:hypothetical membrane protein